MGNFVSTFRLVGDDSDLRSAFRRSASESAGAFGRIGADIKTATSGARGFGEAVRGSFGWIGSAATGFGAGALFSQLGALHDEGIERGRQMLARVEAERAVRDEIARTVAQTVEELRSVGREQSTMEASLKRISSLTSEAMAKLSALNKAATEKLQEPNSLGLVMGGLEAAGGAFWKLIPERLLSESSAFYGPGMDALEDFKRGVESSTGRGRLLAERRLRQGLEREGSEAKERLYEAARLEAEKLDRQREIERLRAEGNESAARMEAEALRYSEARAAIEKRRADMGEAWYAKALDAERRLNEANRARILREQEAGQRTERERREAADAAERAARDRRLGLFDARSGGGATPETRFTAGALGVVSGLSQRVGLGAAVDGAARQHAEAQRTRVEQTRILQRLEDHVRRNSGRAGVFS